MGAHDGNIRSPSIIARYGGEEFGIIIPETGSPGAETWAEGIRKGVEELTIPHSASDTVGNVTVGTRVFGLPPPI